MAKRQKTVQYRDCFEQVGLTADPREPILRNVKVLGFNSKNGRRYTPEAAREALALYEGCMVNFDHPSTDPSARRSVRDRLGKLEGLKIVEGDGIRGNLRYNPEHADAKAIRWFAQNMPEALGLSHNAVGQGVEEQDGTFTVHRIPKVRSVDLVADPATTKGLYESMDPMMMDGGLPEETEGGSDDALLNAAAEILKDGELSAKDKLAKIKAVLKIVDGDKAPEESDPVEKPDEQVKEDIKPEKTVESPTVKDLQEELDRYKAKEAFDKRKSVSKQLCEQAGLPKELVTGIFLEQLAAAPSDKAARELIEDRRILAGRQPKSAGPSTGKKMTDAEFLESLTGN